MTKTEEGRRQRKDEGSMDIAVYSGSFNPLHIGHLAIMKHMTEEAGFWYVYLIVLGIKLDLISSWICSPRVIRWCLSEAWEN